MHSSRRDPARPQNAFSGLVCIVFSVAVNVSCHVDVRVTPPPFSSGLGTGNGGVETELLQRFQPAYKCLDCIEQYLDHIGRINSGYEVKVKNHCLNQIHEEYLNNM